MSSETNHCLKGPQDQVVGFRLDTAELGHEIYDILDWADEHVASHVVEQTDDYVYVYSETARETLSVDELRAEPLSIRRRWRRRRIDRLVASAYIEGRVIYCGQTPRSGLIFRRGGRP